MVEKLIVAGCGGIGSHFITNIVNEIASGQSNIKHIQIYDPDKIELKNKLYTTFDCSADQLGKSKVKIIKDNLEFILEMNGKTAKIEVFESNFTETDLKNFANANANTTLVSTVDGSKFRESLLRICDSKFFRSYPKANWIDMRSHGGRILIFSNPTTTEDYVMLSPYFVDRGVENASCQRPEDLAAKKIQYGNQIIAMIGKQYIANLERGLRNELIRESDYSGQSNKQN